MYKIYSTETLELFETPEWEDVTKASDLELSIELGIRSGDLESLRQFSWTQPSPEKLAEEFGMTTRNSRRLAAAIELMRRYHEQGNKRISYPAEAIPYLEAYRRRPQEHFVCITLDGAHQVIDVHLISVGLVNRTVVHPREVFRPALSDNAAAVIVAHNHPSGNQQPSDDDRDVIKRLVEAAKHIGVPVLDHLVISKNGYYSFLEHGDM